MQQETIGLALAISSSVFIGSSFIIKKRGLRAAGATGIRAGQALQLSAAPGKFMSCCCTTNSYYCTYHGRTHFQFGRCWGFQLPERADMVGRAAVHGGWGASQLCCVRVCTSHFGHASGSTKHHNQVSWVRCSTLWAHQQQLQELAMHCMCTSDRCSQSCSACNCFCYRPERTVAGVLADT
eukprot:GHRQ01020131.1.p1 GENE.GHRQ01020131.1~~GHRQ01020131.1.p1  ORF type:complete len:181 (+),score=3.34 GHRQ01020131.1:246-788(+)